MTTTTVGQNPDEPDERRLYGDPQHQVGADVDPERMYGTPQHEDGSTSDVEQLWLDCRAFRLSVRERC